LVLPKSTPLLIVGRGTSAYEAGAIWHFLDHRMGQPATLVDADDIASVDFSEYTCVILPGGSYSQWGAAQADSLRAYVRGGGTLIAMTSSINWLKRFDFLPKSEEPAAEPEQADKAQTTPRPSFGEAADARALESIAGAFLNVQVDPTHPLAYGFPDDSVPVFRDHSNRFALPKNPFKTAASYTGVIAGYVSQKNRKSLVDSAAVWAEPIGDGTLILLADHPVFRGYVRSSERFLTNAILLGPVLNIPSSPTADESSSEAESSDSAIE